MSDVSSGNRRQLAQQRTIPRPPCSHHEHQVTNKLKYKTMPHLMFSPQKAYRYTLPSTIGRTLCSTCAGTINSVKIAKSPEARTWVRWRVSNKYKIQSNWCNVLRNFRFCMVKKVWFDIKLIEITQVWRKLSRKVMFMLEVTAILKNGSHHFLEYSYASLESTVSTNAFTLSASVILWIIVIRK